MARQPTPPPAAPAKRTSTLKKVVYIVILIVVVSLILQALGVGVMNHREENTIIERPHQSD